VKPKIPKNETGGRDSFLKLRGDVRVSTNAVTWLFTITEKIN
jgi:hypothetical protein